MKTMNSAALCLLVLLCATLRLHATTWDEPWIRDVVREADHFVLVRIESSDEHKGASVKVLKELGGNGLPNEFKIKDFFMLDLTSMSGGHGPEFHFGDIDSCYFFIKKNDKGEYCMPTPTTGFDYVANGNVVTAYRHSYHKAMVPMEVYELTMKAIFNHAHGLDYDKEAVRAFVSKQLADRPHAITKEEMDKFFLQHAALEVIYHLRLEGYCDQIIPFFKDPENFHNRVSAARAFVTCNTAQVQELLLEKIGEKTKENEEDNDDFTKVICVWTLAEWKPTALKGALERLAMHASEEYTGFGGNIMDPRVGTHFPTVKSALEKLVAEL